MNHFETRKTEIAPSPPSPSRTSTGVELQHGRRGMTANVSSSDRVVELELENSRLQQLVAELLIKNHHLRKVE